MSLALVGRLVSGVSIKRRKPRPKPRTQPMRQRMLRLKRRQSAPSRGPFVTPSVRLPRLSATRLRLGNKSPKQNSRLRRRRRTMLDGSGMPTAPSLLLRMRFARHSKESTKPVGMQRAPFRSIVTSYEGLSWMRSLRPKLWSRPEPLKRGLPLTPEALTLNAAPPTLLFVRPNISWIRCASPTFNWSERPKMPPRRVSRTLIW